MMRGKGFVVLVVLGVTFLAFFYVGQRTHVIRMGYDLEALKSEKKKLEQIHNQLLIEVSTLASLERVEWIATGSLGMKRPSADQIVLVTSPAPGDSETLRVAGRSDGSKPIQVAWVRISGFPKVSGGETPTLIQKIKDEL